MNARTVQKMKLWSRVARLRSLFGRYQQDGYLRGRAAQVVGTALIADGLVGLENPLDGKTKRSGVVGAFIMMVVGLFLALGLGFLFDDAKPYDHGSVANGVVVSVATEQTRDSKGHVSTSCTPTVQYDVAGKSYTVTTTYSSSSLCDKQGSDVKVSYLPSNPAAGRPLFSVLKTVAWISSGVGWLLAISGMLTFLTRVAEIVGGAILFFKGRRLVSEHAPVSTEQLMAELREAWAGGANELFSAAGPSGPAGRHVQSPTPGLGALSALGGLVGGVASQAQQPVAASSAPIPHAAQPVGPPPGWYPDPAGSGMKRWWDGTTWTDHLQQ